MLVSVIRYIFAGDGKIEVSDPNGYFATTIFYCEGKKIYCENDFVGKCDANTNEFSLSEHLEKMLKDGMKVSFLE